MAQFLVLRTEKLTSTKELAEEIPILQQEFSSRFQDFRKHEALSVCLQQDLMIMSKSFQANFD
jgi:hypothetical protein